MTNRDKLNLMSNNELAVFLCQYDPCYMCPNEKRRICNYRDCNDIDITKAWLESEEN